MGVLYVDGPLLFAEIGTQETDIKPRELKKWKVFFISEVPGFVLPLSSVHLVASIPEWHIWWCKIFFAAVASIRESHRLLKQVG